MHELIHTLEEEARRNRAIASIASEWELSRDYLHKAELFEQAADIIREYTKELSA